MKSVQHDDDAAVICEALDNVSADLARPRFGPASSRTLQSRIRPTRGDELTLTIVKAFTSAFRWAPPRQQFTQKLVALPPLPRTPVHQQTFTQPLPRRASPPASSQVLRERIPRPKPTDPYLPFLPTERYELPREHEHHEHVSSMRSTFVLLLSAIVMTLIGLGLLSRVL